VLVGDDWSWEAVRHDVTKFARTITQNSERARKLAARLPGTTDHGGVTVYREQSAPQWFLFK
jgi:hypothetical protein